MCNWRGRHELKCVRIINVYVINFFYKESSSILAFFNFFQRYVRNNFVSIVLFYCYFWALKNKIHHCPPCKFWISVAKRLDGRICHYQLMISWRHARALCTNLYRFADIFFCRNERNVRPRKKNRNAIHRLLDPRADAVMCNWQDAHVLTSRGTIGLQGELEREKEKEIIVRSYSRAHLSTIWLCCESKRNAYIQMLVAALKQRVSLAERQFPRESTLHRVKVSTQMWIIRGARITNESYFLTWRAMCCCRPTLCGVTAT